MQEIPLFILDGQISQIWPFEHRCFIFVFESIYSSNTLMSGLFFFTQDTYPSWLLICFTRAQVGHPLPRKTLLGIALPRWPSAQRWSILVSIVWYFSSGIIARPSASSAATYSSWVFFWHDYLTLYLRRQGNLSEVLSQMGQVAVSVVIKSLSVACESSSEAVGFHLT